MSPPTFTSIDQKICYVINLTTSAVRSTNLESMLIFASCLFFFIAEFGPSRVIIMS